MSLLEKSRQLAALLGDVQMGKMLLASSRHSQDSVL